MARFRAVVVIQPPGLGGRPSAGHFRRATANASRVLGEIDVAEDSDQGGHRSTGLLAEDPADQRVVDDGQGSAAGHVREGSDLDRRRDRPGDP